MAVSKCWKKERWGSPRSIQATNDRITSLRQLKTRVWISPCSSRFITLSHLWPLSKVAPRLTDSRWALRMSEIMPSQEPCNLQIKPRHGPETTWVHLIDWRWFRHSLRPSGLASTQSTLESQEPHSCATLSEYSISPDRNKKRRQELLSFWKSLTRFET